jgi:Tfp pilus assembly protein PilV
MGMEMIERRRERGVSLIEAVIAAGLLLVIAAGILPLFAQSLSNNLAGSDSTAVSNTARSRVEEMIEMPFGSPEITLTAGSALVTNAYFSLADQKWVDGEETLADPAVWTRTATIRQYSINALDDQKLETSEALTSDADPGQVHFKELEIAVAGTRLGGPLGPSRRIQVRMLKSH